MPRFTFCLSFDKANPNTYPNWTTVEFCNGRMLRLTNAGGNGQTWEPIGTFDPTAGSYTLDAPNDDETTHAYKVINTVMARKGKRSLGFRGLYGFCLNASMVDVTGSKVTAAPTLANGGKPPRDKNLTPSNVLRETDEKRSDEMHARILAMRAAEKAEKEKAKRAKRA